MRIGSVTGHARREADGLDAWARSRTRLRRARTRRSVAIASGSPPLTMTSRTSGCARSHASAGAERLERHGALAAADHARARAEAAVDGAAIGREEQDAVGVALDEVRRDLVRDLAQRVGEVPGHLVGLARMRARTACGWGSAGRAGSTSDR